MISINWPTKVIFVPKTYLTSLGGTNYSLNVNQFRLDLKALEAAEGISYPSTHNHNTEVNIGGLTLARVVELTNGYSVTFEDGQYSVSLVGANTNIGDLVNLNQVSVRSSNSAGLVVSSATGIQPAYETMIERILDLIEADEQLTPTTVKKFVKGTSTELLSKTVTGGNITPVTIAE
jgi:hypothetical protein